MKGLIFVCVLTYGGAVLALFRPFYGLLVYMCFAVLRPERLWTWSLPDDGNFSLTIGVALLIGWGIHSFGNWDFGSAKPVARLLVCYWVWIITSAFFAENQNVAWAYVVLHSKILIPILVGMTLIKTWQEVRTIAWTLALCLGFLAYEAHGMYWGGGLVLFREEGMLGMDNNSICIAMATGVGLTIFLAFSESSLVLKILAFVLAAMMVHVPMFGDSRGGMLGVVVVGIVAFALLPKRMDVVLTYFVGTLVVVRLAGAGVVERFSTIFSKTDSIDASALSRVELWKDCWDVMIHHPLVGIGPNHWPLIAEHYGWPAGKEAHSVWFNCGAELGFVGLGLLLAFYLTVMFLAWRLLTCRVDLAGPQREMGSMVIAALCGYMITASFVSLDALEVPFYIVLIGVGMLKITSTASELTSEHAAFGNLESRKFDRWGHSRLDPPLVRYRFKLRQN